MITVFAEQKTARLQYILDVLIRHVLGEDFRLISDWDKFIKLGLPRINYSTRELKGVIQIVPHNLLFEQKIKPRKIKVRKWKGLPCFFLTAKKTPYPYDILAGSFYLVSRYEEYLDFRPDSHGRFPAKESLAFREGFLDIPLVNRWAMWLAQDIRDSNPDYNLSGKAFRSLTTIDVDMAFTYRNKGVWRTLGGLTRELLNLDLKKAEKRIRVLKGAEKDPFDNFDYQSVLHRRMKVESVYFILLADHGKVDKNISYDNEEFIQIVKQLDAGTRVGIHPSYQSNSKKKKLNEEIQRLEDILLHEVTCSRQHFLKLELPESYRNLIKAGITEDHTMGYSELPGFRAGICSPFPFFDLERGESTSLMLFPFAVMDVALNHHMKLRPEEAIRTIAGLIREVRKVKGLFISVFHNESLSDFDNWKGWRSVYEKMLSLATSDDPLLPQ